MASFWPEFLVLLAALCSSAFALGADVHVGEPAITREFIQSDILQEKRPIRVHLPPGYELSGSHYPVLFILDADQGDHFQKSALVADSLAESGDIPGMIIVGIENTDRLRDMNVPEFEYQGKSIFAMVSHPALFKAYIASSPSFFVNEEAVMANTRKFFAGDKSLDRIFFVNLGTEDTEKRVKQTKAYATLVKQLAPSEFKWELRVMRGEGHVPAGSLEDGLEMIFYQKRPK